MFSTLFTVAAGADKNLSNRVAAACLRPRLFGLFTADRSARDNDAQIKRDSNKVLAAVRKKNNPGIFCA